MIKCQESGFTDRAPYASGLRWHHFYPCFGTYLAQTSCKRDRSAWAPGNRPRVALVTSRSLLAITRILRQSLSFLGVRIAAGGWRTAEIWRCRCQKWWSVDLPFARSFHVLGPAAAFLGGAGFSMSDYRS